MFETTYHEHTGNDGDGPQIDAKAGIKNAPQPALTAATGGSLTSGGSSDLKTADATIIANAIIRLGQIETALRKIGLIK